MEFEELLARERGAVERFVKFRVPSPEEAEDILQETYLAAFRGFPALKSEGAFKAWILEIARRRCADWYRARRETVPLDETPESRFVSSRRGRGAMPAVAEAMEALPQRDRELLALFYWRELSVTEIAKRLSVPEGTVKSRLHAARERFREKYPVTSIKEGVKKMKDLPEIMPHYTIRKLDLEPFEVKWEELPGWLIIPRLGEKLRWGLYDAPSGRRTEWAELEVIGRAVVHGVEGVELTAVQYDTQDYYRTGAIDRSERRFVAQLTDTHCRFLAESHVQDGVRLNYTFLDGPSFLDNWGFGPDNRGNETDLRRKGVLTREGDAVTGELKPDLQSQDVVGRYEVTLGGKTYDTVCVMDVECFNDAVASEQFIDKTGRTVLWRRFNRNDWAFKRYGRLWTDMLPTNPRLTVNGETYVHWYDCLTDYIL